jgi:hypothetical protein
MIEIDVDPPQPEKHIPPKWVYQKYETYSINTEPPEPKSLEK